MRRLHAIRDFHHDERGFTLIETLVAMISAIVVVGALYAILDISVQQTARITDAVQATQIGRITMTKLVGELHSACISPGFTPVQEESGENKLIFINAYSASTEIPIAYKHEIVWEESSGRIVDKIYKSNGGSWPKFTFPATKTEATVLGERISEIPLPLVVKTEKQKYTKIFRYYIYSKTSTSINAEESLSTLKEITPVEASATEEKLTVKQSEETAGVEVNYRQYPIDKYGAESRTVDLKTLTTLSFSVPNAETPIEAKPCE